MKILKIKNKEIKIPVVQGGMGIGVSLYRLASAVASEGGIGVISSAALDIILSKRYSKKFDNYTAVRKEIELAKSYGKGGCIGINIMVALQKDYESSVKAAVDEGVDAIISGGGLPLNLPSITDPHDTALIPIVSSPRSLELICKKWEKQGYRPDACILEGPLAGGHLGFKIEDIDKEENKLENLLPMVKEVAKKYGDFPVIAAGGIYDRTDIKNIMKLGADGVQMGTRFLATEESGASFEYKQAVVNAKRENIIVAYKPGSPCGLPFRVIKNSPMYVSALSRIRKPKCNMGYVLTKDENGKLTKCDAKEENYQSFCICNGLLSSSGYNSDTEEPLYTVGVVAERVNKIQTVSEIFKELCLEN
ncbi:MAG: nitronate monooxygenase [Proteobacteria bacterium]|nr:nitronate monooxygenase [Pseudomonadota bacterium]